MKPRLILQGEIGCGKSTLIRECIGDRCLLAGGFLTYRVTKDGIPIGFFLTRASCMESLSGKAVPTDMGRCFLSLSPRLKQQERVFSEYGVRLLEEARDRPFSLFDEIGGVELLEDAFWEALQAFLTSQLPCLAVLKTGTAVQSLCDRIPLGETYVRRYRQLYDLLTEDGASCFCTVREQGDNEVRQIITKWVKTYEKK